MVSTAEEKSRLCRVSGDEKPLLLWVTANQECTIGLIKGPYEAVESIFLCTPYSLQITRGKFGLYELTVTATGTATYSFANPWGEVETVGLRIAPPKAKIIQQDSRRLATRLLTRYARYALAEKGIKVTFKQAYSVLKAAKTPEQTGYAAELAATFLSQNSGRAKQAIRALHHAQKSPLLAQFDEQSRTAVIKGAIVILHIVATSSA